MSNIVIRGFRIDLSRSEFLDAQFIARTRGVSVETVIFERITTTPR